MKKLKETGEDVQSLSLKILCISQNSVEMTKQCLLYKDDIVKLVRRKQEIERLIALQKSELSHLRRRLQIYNRHLDEHCNHLLSVETGRVDYQALLDRVVALRQRKEAFDVKQEQDVRTKEKLTGLHDQHTALSPDIGCLRNQIDQIHSRQDEVRQATAVLTKKRAAQVLRLRCQIKERSDRHRRLREQYNILQGTLASLQQHQLEALK